MTTIYEIDDTQLDNKITIYRNGVGYGYFLDESSLVKVLQEHIYKSRTTHSDLTIKVNSDYRDEIKGLVTSIMEQMILR